MSLTAAQIYDFETALEAAFAAVLGAAGFATILTPGTGNQFQENRPRLELLVRAESERAVAQLAPDSTNTLRNLAFTGSLVIALITDSDPAGKTTHAALRAQLRAALGLQLRGTIGGNLTCHRLDFIRQTGTDYEFAPDKGFERTAHNYALDFSIYPPALAQYP